MFYSVFVFVFHFVTVDGYCSYCSCSCQLLFDIWYLPFCVRLAQIKSKLSKLKLIRVPRILMRWRWRDQKETARQK